MLEGFMKNNYRSKILTMLLVLSLLILPVTSFAQSELIVGNPSFDNMGSITSMKLVESNNSFMKSNHSDYFDFSDVKLSNDRLNLKGYVNNKEFNLTGTLYASENSSDLIVGNLLDTTNNYEVLYFGLSTNPSETLIVNSETKDILKKNGYAGFLYLRDIQSNDMKFIEFNPTKIISKNNFKSMLSNLRVCNHEDQFWYAKILEPIEVKAVDLPLVENIALSEPRTEGLIEYRGLITPMAATYQDTVYTYSYNVSGAYVDESIKVRHYIDGPSTLYSQGTFVAKLMIVEEKTVSSNVPSMNSSNSNMKIGAYGDSRVDVATSPGDYLQQVIWGGTYYKPGSIDVQVGWSYSLPGANIGVSTNYTNSSIYTSHTYKSFDNVNGTYVRNDGIKWTKQKHQLIDVNHNFDHSFTVNKLNTSGNKTFTANFSYDVSNGLNYTWGGMQSKTVTKSYYCN